MKLAPGLTVNAASEISGPQWIGKIHASQDIPDYMKKQILWRNNRITTPVKFMFPTNVIKKEWLEAWLSAFYGDWEIATCHLDVTVETLAEIVARQRATGEKTGQKITVNVVPHLSAGERVGGWNRLVQSSHKMFGKNAFSITRGWTFPPSLKKGAKAKVGVSLKTGRGVAFVATRINLKRGTVALKFPFQDSELLEVFFHELACHAGRQTRGLVDTHGDLTVDTWAAEIEAMFPKSTTFKKVVDTIYRLAGFNVKGASTGTGRGSLGLGHLPVIDSGTLARAASRPPRSMGA